jgi:hypothetical protein
MKSWYGVCCLLELGLAGAISWCCGVQCGGARAVASLEWPRPILCKWRMRLLDFMHCTSMIHMPFQAELTLAWLNELYTWNEEVFVL